VIGAMANGVSRNMLTFEPNPYLLSQIPEILTSFGRRAKGVRPLGATLVWGEDGQADGATAYKIAAWLDLILGRIDLISACLIEISPRSYLKAAG
jgi:hypothetical protein